jgi:hypothetical protein
MPVDPTDPAFSQDIVAFRFSGLLRGEMRYFEFPNITDNYYALCANDSNWNIEFQCLAWAGDHHGSGSLYPPSIFSHTSQPPGGQHGISWYPNGYEGPKAKTMTMDVTPHGPDPLAFDVVIFTIGPRGGGGGGDVGEGCPPDPLWPYQTLSGSAGNGVGGVISHRRVLGGNRKQTVA